MSTSGLPPLRDIDDYGNLDFFAAQEIPYTLVEPQIKVLDLKREKEFPVLVEVPPDQATPTNPPMTAAEAAALEAEFAPYKRIQRFGWLKDASVYDPAAERPITWPDPREDNEAPADEVIYLQNGAGEYLIKTPTGLAFGTPTVDPETRLDNRVKIAKVDTIPYRWRRPDTTVSTTRQVHLIVCYNGPSH